MQVKFDANEPCNRLSGKKLSKFSIYNHYIIQYIIYFNINLEKIMNLSLLKMDVPMEYFRHEML